jgi:hypothetical protein
MAIARPVLATLFLLALAPGLARAQSISAEVDGTAGYSTEDVKAAATQLRIFGEAIDGWRYYAEGSWADVWGPKSDAFGAAYPYNNRFRPMEAYVERTFRPGRYIAGVKAGQYRTPFGLSSRSDHGYTGFLRAPLIRYGSNWALGNTFFDGGVSAMAGVPRLFAEMSVARPRDEDSYKRRSGWDTAMRVQGAMGDVIAGVSHIRMPPAERFTKARGNAEFSGLDVRWMRGGVLLRGEYIDGRPFDGVRTFGGYIDAIVHRPFMGPVTAVARAERLDYVAGKSSDYPRRYTTGARIQLASTVVGHVNVVREMAHRTHPSMTALDLGVTISGRR